MRIAFVSERMLLGFGVDLTIHALGNELSARGHDVTVYASVADDRFEHRAYRLERIPTPAYEFFPRYERRARVWAGLIDDSDHDVVCVTAFPFFSLVPKLRTPTVAIDHGDVPTGGLPAGKRANMAYAHLRAQRMYFPKASEIVTISEFVRSSLPKREARRARTIYHGLDHYPRAEAWRRNEMRELLGLRADERVALYVGRLNPDAQPYKGTADLLDIARAWLERGTGFRLVMAGLGSNQDAERIRAAGAVPVIHPSEAELPALYAAADVYMTASRWEGFDLPVMEAAVQGVPSVALQVGAHPEIVDEGVTGHLAVDAMDLANRCAGLLSDPPRAREMGEAAAQKAATFTWSKAADEFEEVFDRAAARPLQTRVRAPKAAGVTAIILNYEAPAEVLEPCVKSVVDQTHPVDVLIVDNGSEVNRDVLDRMEAAFPSVRVLRLDRNYGFAEGMNRGVAAADTETVLLLNNDIILDRAAVAEMVDVLGADEQVVGVAPKILSQWEPDSIDAVGVTIDPTGSPHNVGIGQLDVGQYDRVEPRIGACFAATLLRTKAFRPGIVGPLDERYFMYFEDVDWCLRASLQGYTFLTAPDAIVYHAHSYSIRKLPYSYKQRLLMRNLVRTIVRTLPPHRWQRVAVSWMRRFAKATIFGPARLTNVRILVSVIATFPRYVGARRKFQRRVRRSYDDLLRMRVGEEPYFDAAAYRPLRTLWALHAMYRRLYLLTGDATHLTIAQTARTLAETTLGWEREIVWARLLPLVENEPAAVKDYILNLEEVKDRP
jgi:GT2 family glycosyltransferase/glycosyltransferase involved in cell wall biosynthesis